MGIFAKEANLWTYHRVTLQFRARIMGGVPYNPKIIEGWLRSKAGVTQDEEVRQALLQTLMEMGAEVRPDMTYDELVMASEELAAEKSTNGFKRNDDIGLYIEGRQVKAAIKESVNIHFAGERWGKTKKGPKSYTAERVFVLEDRIPLGRPEPDGVDLVIGHVTGPAGPRSTLAYHEYALRPEISFTIMEAKVVQDAAQPPSLEREQWAVVWTSMEENGIGALRSQGHGRFDVTKYEEVQADEVEVGEQVTEMLTEAAGG